jgi:hypothetical protein
MRVAQLVTVDGIKANLFPEEMFTGGVTYNEYRNVTTFVYNADYWRLIVMVAEYMAGIWPIPESGGTATPQL